MYQTLVKKLLFRFDPETAHHLTFSMLAAGMPVVGGAVKSQFRVENPVLETKAFGLTFPNQVGLAAGLDKNGLLLAHWSKFGFGFAEIGTITPKPQEGNPKPRLFRLPADHALINRMGFNNDGVDVLARRLEKRPEGLIIGANIGKNKATANEDAAKDYAVCFQRLHDRCDYFTVNVSSPNTPGLRALQERDALEKILGTLQNMNQGLKRPKPIVLKIAPDLTDWQIDETIDVVRQTRLSGMVATNTTIERGGLKTPPAVVESMGAGGLSGRPLHARSVEVVKRIADAGVEIAGVGGIDSPQTAMNMADAGAKLVQIYSGFIYEGPALTTEILKAFVKRRKN